MIGVTQNRLQWCFHRAEAPYEGADLLSIQRTCTGRTLNDALSLTSTPLNSKYRLAIAPCSHHLLCDLEYGGQGLYGKAGTICHYGQSEEVTLKSSLL